MPLIDPAGRATSLAHDGIWSSELSAHPVGVRRRVANSWYRGPETKKARDERRERWGHAAADKTAILTAIYCNAGRYDGESSLSPATGGRVSAATGTGFFGEHRGRKTAALHVVRGSVIL